MERKIDVVICAGTACYVMGATDILLLVDYLPDHLKDLVDVRGETCLGYCKDFKKGKAPYVTINGELMSDASVPMVIEKIQELVDAECK